MFLHGYTENATTRPYGGWRAFKPPPAKPSRRRRDPTPEELKLAKWRQGIDDKDVAPVRDVALDQAEQQLEDSGLTQLVIVLPQGGLTSQFGDVGEAGQYVKAVADELSADKVWRDPTGNAVTSAPHDRAHHDGRPQRRRCDARGDGRQRGGAAEAPRLQGC